MVLQACRDLPQMVIHVGDSCIGGRSGSQPGRIDHSSRLLVTTAAVATTAAVQLLMTVAITLLAVMMVPCICCSATIIRMILTGAATVERWLTPATLF